MSKPYVSKDMSRCIQEAPMGGYWIAYEGGCVPINVNENGDGEHEFRGERAGLFIGRNDDAAAWFRGSTDDEHQPTAVEDPR